MLVDFDLSTKLAPKIFTPSAKLSPTATPKTLNPVKKNKNTLSKFYNCCYPTVSGTDSVHPAESVNSEPSHDSYDSHSKSNSFVGTEEYVSPEMIQGNGHDYAVDWWCLGIVLYEMLYGTTPFRGINRKETFYRILSKTPELVGEPTSLRDLIRRLLEKDPTQRISVNEIKGHDFFKGVDWEKVVMISRPPFIPGPLDESSTDESKIIDIEDFVRGVFKVEDDVIADVNKEKESNEVKDFLVF
nr:serine/threonine-protein kinase OXI1-like [Tanacetum cinerariifolium]